MAHLIRDPFSRCTLERHLVKKEDRKLCLWCGHAQGRFVYTWVADTLGVVAIDYTQAFCCKSCWEQYNE